MKTNPHRIGYLAAALCGLLVLVAAPGAYAQGEPAPAPEATRFADDYLSGLRLTVADPYLALAWRNSAGGTECTAFDTSDHAAGVAIVGRLAASIATWAGETVAAWSRKHFDTVFDTRPMPPDHPAAPLCVLLRQQLRFMVVRP